MIVRKSYSIPGKLLRKDRKIVFEVELEKGIEEFDLAPIQYEYAIDNKLVDSEERVVVGFADVKCPGHYTFKKGTTHTVYCGVCGKYNNNVNKAATNCDESLYYYAEIIGGDQIV